MNVPLSQSELARYSRHLSLREIGLTGQEKLKAARVLVIGAGGLGSPSILYLAAAGVGTIGIVDFDTVDVSNLQRQVLFDTASVGSYKAAIARERLLALNPEITVIAHQIELQANNVREVFANYDVILDGTDRFGTRYLVNDACVILRKPLVSAAIHRFEGQAFTYVPDDGPCYRCLFAEPPADGLVPNCAEAGVLGVLPGVLGGIQATEAIKLIAGVGEPLIGRLLAYDALEMRFSEFKFARRNDCAVCGDHPTILSPTDLPEFCSSDVLAAIRRVSARELQVMLVQQAERIALIDVREPREFNAGHLPNAVNIPVRELQHRSGELPTQTQLVFMCRSGVRSLAACGIAARAGAISLVHLDGGLLAWASEVDPSFAVASA
ncbi:MAG: molybdopterin-synthase adenylyltransferase MoeB [Candidatus Obscuribacterales bacterium]|nr:molybdopterin-synthase adenylyltransferase MoeB [Steroidobacteraceae bacterium]